MRVRLTFFSPSLINPQENITAAIYPRVPSEGGKISVVSTIGHLAVCRNVANCWFSANPTAKLNGTFCICPSLSNFDRDGYSNKIYLCQEPEGLSPQYSLLFTGIGYCQSRLAGADNFLYNINGDGMAREDGGRITPEMARVLLMEDGIEVDAEQAKMILDFLYAMAEIAVDRYLGAKQNT